MLASRGAHPRSRGENSRIAEMSPATVGSSPLTRGKLRPRRGFSPRGRLIPAHAGKTQHRRPRHDEAQAHPRSRGENERLVLIAPSEAGSSPLTRGKLRVRDGESRPSGLIPAHAGKTWNRARALSRPWAHPRSRGENIDGQRETAEEWGSSPLTRGKQPRTRPWSR